jgi:predicted GIY-YIG superfamily endonuclease
MSATNRLTGRSRTWHARPDLDRTAVRYFVYFLCDASGKAIYIGRSCNVPARIRSHHAEAAHESETYDRYLKREWFFDVRSVSLAGPFTWDDAVKRERAEIELHQPRGNRDLTVAYRSAARAGGAS